MDMTNLRGKVALVTGAGSGIGRATALELARRGADLVLCGVEAANVAATAREVEAAGRKALHRQVDVAKRDEVAAFADEVHAQYPAIDILINNAGVGLSANFSETTLEDWDWLLGVNLWGYIHVLHFFLPRMIERRAGHVVNVASAAAFVGLEINAAYTTSKWAVAGLSESLRMQLDPIGIGVTTVCPAMVKTDMLRTSRRRGRFESEEVNRKMGEMFAEKASTAERAALELIDAMARNKSIAPIAGAAPMYYLKRFVPGAIPFIARNMQGKILGKQ